MTSPLVASLPDQDVSRLSGGIARDLPGRYRLLGYLSRGAFATVWRAMDRLTGQVVAVKCFDPQTGRRRGDYYQELRALFLLRHDNVVSILDLMETPEGRRYLVLEFCAGGTLRQALAQTRSRGERCPQSRAAQVGRDLARGLAAAHKLGITHRDLKPENVLFAESQPLTLAGTSSAKLTDFGLARMAAPTSDDEPLRGVSGSPLYMAPEQFVGSFTPASDLYALGVLLYELLHGGTPFLGGPEELARQHLYEPSPVGGDLPEPWPELLTGLLGKDGATRPSAAEVADRLDKLVPPRPRWSAWVRPSAAETPSPRFDFRRSPMTQNITLPAREEAALRGGLADLAGMMDDPPRPPAAAPVAPTAKLPLLEIAPPPPTPAPPPPAEAPSGFGELFGGFDDAPSEDDVLEEATDVTERLESPTERRTTNDAFNGFTWE